MVKITLTAKEVSQMLGVSINTVYTAARANQIPHTKLRGRILFNQEVLEEWVKDQARKMEVKV